MHHLLFTERWLNEMDSWIEIDSRTYYTPLGPWEEDREFPHPSSSTYNETPVVSERDRYVAEMQRSDFLEVGSTFRPLLMMQGYFEETIDKWIEKSGDELRNLKKKQYVKVRLFLGYWSTITLMLRDGFCSGTGLGRLREVEVSSLGRLY